jgi:hypothetical protein
MSGGAFFVARVFILGSLRCPSFVSIHVDLPSYTAQTHSAPIRIASDVRDEISRERRQPAFTILFSWDLDACPDC